MSTRRDVSLTHEKPMSEVLAAIQATMEKGVDIPAGADDILQAREVLVLASQILTLKIMDDEFAIDGQCPLFAVQRLLSFIAIWMDHTWDELGCPLPPDDSVA